MFLLSCPWALVGADQQSCPLTWQVKAAITYALSVGYRHIDCAAVYGNEMEIGEALKANVGSGKVRTGDVESTG